MLKIFFCDDRQEHLDSLEKQIEDLMTLDYQIKKFTDARILAEELHSEDADILLTDIQMPGINGIQLAGESGNINRHIQIIFITAYEDTYVEDIFAVRPVYMLKNPVKKEKLEEALKLAIDNLNDENSYITITAQNKTLRIYAEDIEYVESQQRKVFFYEHNHHEECYMKMDDIQHDFKDQILCLKQLMQNNSEESLALADSIVKSLEKDISDSKVPVFTSNVLVNTVLFLKTEEAKEKEIAI